MIVLKRDGTWECFDPDKVRSSIKRAAMVADDLDIAGVTKAVVDRVNAYGGKISSDTIRAIVKSALEETQSKGGLRHEYEARSENAEG